jgi:hypothetical protein
MPEESEQAEERRVLANDVSVRRQQGATFLDHVRIDDAGGRFAAVNETTIIGRDAPPSYPQLPSNSPWSGPDIVPPEPPLGYRVDEMTPLEPPPVDPLGGASGGAADEPSGLASLTDVEHAAPASFHSEEEGDDAA